jgi:Rad3-related DNA helicase
MSLAIASHIKKVITETIKTLSEDARVEKLVLTEYIDCLVRHGRSRQEIHRLRDQKQKLQVENANRDELKKRMADMSTFLKKQSTALAEYDEQLIRRLIEKVTVHEEKFTVEFKSGVTVDVEE